MQKVTVLLKENVESLGLIGDVVRVTPGYARNFLFPRGYAIVANPENVKVMERRRVRYEAEQAAREADMQKKIEALGKVRLVTREKADETGSLYGSVSAAVVARLLVEQGYAIAEKDVRLEEPLKTVGTHEIPIHVYGEHYAGIQLVVEATSS